MRDFRDFVALRKQNAAKTQGRKQASMLSEQTGGGAPRHLSSAPAPDETSPATTPVTTPAATSVRPAPTPLPAPAPLALRYVRLLTGVLLLAVAFGGILLELVLVTNLREALGRVLPLSLHAMFVATLDALAGIWLLALVIGCLLVGAMSLALVLTRRGW